MIHFSVTFFVHLQLSVLNGASCGPTYQPTRCNCFVYDIHSMEGHILRLEKGFDLRVFFIKEEKKVDGSRVEERRNDS